MVSKRGMVRLVLPVCLTGHFKAGRGHMDTDGAVLSVRIKIAQGIWNDEFLNQRLLDLILELAGFKCSNC